MSRGLGRVFQRGSVWWLDYTVGGKRHREPTDAATKRDAGDILRERIGDRRSGKIIGRPDHVTLGDLRDGLKRHFEREGNRSWTSAKYAFNHLVRVLGETTPVTELTTQRINKYVEQRLGETFKHGKKLRPVSRAQVRYEVANLSSAFTVAVVEDQILATRPTYQKLSVRNARAGFFTQGDIAALLIELPAFPYNQAVRLAYYIGWRRGELSSLTWDQVDWESKTVRIDPPTDAKRTKAEDQRVIPFGGTPIEEVLAEAWAVRKGPFVFHRNGERIFTFYKVWKRACKKAGLVGKRMHDFRRTAARDLINAGVDRKLVREIVGWKSDAMLDRYHIVDESDVAGALAKRFGTANGTVTAQKSRPADLLPQKP